MHHSRCSGRYVPCHFATLHCFISASFCKLASSQRKCRVRHLFLSFPTFIRLHFHLQRDTHSSCPFLNFVFHPAYYSLSSKCFTALYLPYFQTQIQIKTQNHNFLIFILTKYSDVRFGSLKSLEEWICFMCLPRTFGFPT